MKLKELFKKTSCYDNSHFVCEGFYFFLLSLAILMWDSCYFDELYSFSFSIFFYGGDPARSCEGRPVPSIPPLPWPTLLCFNFKWVLFFEYSWSLDYIFWKLLCNVKSIVSKREAISLPTDCHTAFAMTKNRWSRSLKPLAMTIHTAFVSDHFHVKILFSKIFVRISFLKRFIEVEALLGLSKALIRFIYQPQT